MKAKILSVIFLLLLIPTLTLAEEEGEDLEVFGLELEKILNLGSGLLALGLSVLTWISFKRTENKRLAYVTIAFLLFAIKGFLMGSEIFFNERVWTDPVTSVLDFAILLSFFFGILKK